MKTKILLAFLLLLSCNSFAEKAEVKAIPYDTLISRTDSTGKNIIDRRNCPAVYNDLKPGDFLMPAHSGYRYKGPAIKIEKKASVKELFVELSPVTAAAKEELAAATDSTEKLLDYLEAWPMLANGVFYYSFYRAMEKNAVKNKSLKFANIMGDIAYKDEKNGICAVTSVSFDAGPRGSPVAPAAAGDSGLKNELNVYFFDSNGKVKYRMARNCARYISFKTAFDDNKKVMTVTEEYVSAHLNNLQGDIHVKLEYTVSFPEMKFGFDKFTYYTEVGGRVYKPVEYKINSGAADAKNNK